MVRIGQGFDTHQFVDEKPLVLGGVEIPFNKGLLAHSDGDALIHAICDALLGAAALGDIGSHFPETSAEHAGQNSRDFLVAVKSMLQDRGYAIGNIDSTIVAEAPKMSPHVEAMRKNIADALGIEVSQVSVKATRNEKMGHLGRGEGIAAHAVVILNC